MVAAATTPAPATRDATASPTRTSNSVDSESGQVAPIGPFRTGLSGRTNATRTAPPTARATLQVAQRPATAAQTGGTNGEPSVPAIAPARTIAKAGYRYSI